MARNQEKRANIKYGRCTNTGGKEDGTPCSKCQNKDIQAIRASKDFICEECGEPLQKVDYNPPPNWPIKAIIIALAVIGCVVGAWVILHGQSEQESISITLNIDTLNLNVGDSETIETTISTQPTDANITVFYTSDNVNVAQVDNTGEVHAIAKGEANIVVFAQMGNGIVDTAQVKVFINESSKSPLDTVDEKRSESSSENGGKNSKNYGTCNLGWGIYNGPMKNGKPHGTHGKITVTQTYSINLNDLSGETIIVYPEETIITNFVNGYLRSGEVYSKSGKNKLIPNLF